MVSIPPVSTWWRHLQAKVMKMQWIETTCHSIWTNCNRRRIYICDILEGKVQLVSQHIQQTQSTDYKDEVFQLKSETKELSVKEIVQLVWHSFRLSQWDMALQFTMLYMAHGKYQTQDWNQEELEKEFRKTIWVWNAITQWSNWYTWWKVDFKLSQSMSHDTVDESTVYESSKKSPFFSMLISGKWHTQRSLWREWTNFISYNSNYLLKWRCIENIFERDFKYLYRTEDTNWRLHQPFGCTPDKVFPWRPNRDSKNDGSNTLKDRYFSFFVWYIIKGNSTWNNFFDEYFWDLRNFFSQWFDWLPTDWELEEINRQWWENERFYSSLRPHRESYNNSYSSRSFRKITKQDVLTLIAKYNFTHPSTAVDISELWLAEYPVQSTP